MAAEKFVYEKYLQPSSDKDAPEVSNWLIFDLVFIIYKVCKSCSDHKKFIFVSFKSKIFFELKITTFLGRRNVKIITLG